MSAFASYKVEKSVSKNPSRFGSGEIEGVAGPEAANNAASTSSIVPILTLGIPFSSTLALVLSAMLVHGVQPGPTLIQDNPDIFWGVIASIFLGNLMLVVLNQGGLGSGGLNFDAKVRRESFEPIDLFHAHIGGMDAFAHGLKVAAAIRKDGALRDFVKQRYATWDGGIGAEVESGKATFEELEAYMLKKGEADKNASGRQELLENVVNRYLR